MTKAKTDDKDYDLPFEVAVVKAFRILQANPEAQLYQKFTCLSCLTRKTMGTPNKFYKEGKCDECGHITNIELVGCGFLAHLQVGTHKP